jgi:hypothetical protein
MTMTNGDAPRPIAADMNHPHARPWCARCVLWSDLCDEQRRKINRLCLWVIVLGSLLFLNGVVYWIVWFST